MGPRVVYKFRISKIVVSSIFLQQDTPSRSTLAAIIKNLTGSFCCVFTVYHCLVLVSTKMDTRLNATK